MAYSGFPRIVNPDFSPPQDIMSYQEPLDKNYFGEEYTAAPDYSLSTFFDTESFFDRPLTSTEPNTSHGLQAGPNPQLFNPILPMTGLAQSSITQNPAQQIGLPIPIGQSSTYQPTYPLDSPTLEPFESATFSPATYSTSRTPSLCGDFAAPSQIATTATTTTTSPYPIKLESPTTPTSPISQTPPTASTSTTTTRPLRKRGRPRLSRSNSTSSSSKVPKITSTSTSTTAGTRLPHNQVERKYREGLNSELERLRRAVPTLPQSDEDKLGSTKPSKAMVLAGAIEYIQRLERERDEARGEVERLRRERGERRKKRGWVDGNGNDDGDDGMGWLGE